MTTHHSQWGRWGDGDERGALNLVTRSRTVDAVSLVRTGRVVSLAQPMGPADGVAPHRPPAARFMSRDAGDYALGARSPDGFRFAEDVVQFSTHSGTHVDALCHTWRGDELYNGFPANVIRSTTGAQRLGAETLGPVLTRGVLLDFVTLWGGPLEPGQPIEPEHVEAAYALAATEPVEGDAVVIRTGWWENTSAERYFVDEPGIVEAAAVWLARAGVCVVGADNYAVEVQPSQAGTFPVHLALLHRAGVPLIENLDLAELAETAVRVFLFVMAPIALQGSTASPVRPLAVL